MIARTAPLALLALALSSCAPLDPTARAEADAARTPAVRVLGEAQNCINRTQIAQTQVRTNRVIDFEMRGGKVYRNTLPNNCPGLRMERAITFNTSIDQLCSPQIVYVLQNIAGVPQQGAGCGLGPFVPVEYADKNAR